MTYVFHRYAGSWERADQVSGTVSFYLSVFGLAVGIYSLVKDQRQAANPLVESKQLSRPRKRTRRFSGRWAARLLTPTGFLSVTVSCEGAAGAAIIAGTTAAIIAVGPAHDLDLGPHSPHPAATAIPGIQLVPIPTVSRPGLAGAIFRPAHHTDARRGCVRVSGEADIPVDWHLELQVHNLTSPSIPTDPVVITLLDSLAPRPYRWIVSVPLGTPAAANDRFLLLLLTTPDTAPLAPERRRYTGLDAVQVTRGGANAPTDCPG